MALEAEHDSKREVAKISSHHDLGNRHSCLFSDLGYFAFLFLFAYLQWPYFSILPIL